MDNVSHENILLLSDGSDKITCYQDGNFIFTTLDIRTNEELQCFLDRIKLLPSIKTDIPNWMDKITFFDDKKQAETIDENRRKIIDCESNIKKQRIN